MLPMPGKPVFGLRSTVRGGGMALDSCIQGYCQTFSWAGDVTLRAPHLRIASPRVLKYGMEVVIVETQ